MKKHIKDLGDIYGMLRYEKTPFPISYINKLLDKTRETIPEIVQIIEAYEEAIEEMKSPSFYWDVDEKSMDRIDAILAKLDEKLKGV